MKRFFCFLCMLICCVTVMSAICAASTTQNTDNEFVVYVSPDGDDNGDGSPENMLKTPAGVQAFLRKNDVLGKRPIRVVFKEGDYFIDKGIVFTEEDAGTKENPVVWEAEKKGAVRFLGSTVLDGSKFTPVTDEAMLERIPAEARGKVVQMNLTEQGINIKACPPYLWAGNKFTETYTELIVNDKEQMLARWPNGENNYDYWEKVIDPFTTGAGKKGLEYGGTLKYSNPRLSRWTTAKHAWIAGHVGYTWAIERVAVSSVDTEKGYIISDESSGYEFTDSSPKELQIFNLIEELDCATEWYIDWDTNILYYFPAGEIEEDSVFELITLDENMLTFEANTDYYMTIKNFDLSRSKRMLVNISGNHVTLDGCTITYSKGASAVQMSGECVEIINNVIACHDANALRIYGGGDMIKQSVRTHSKVVNNYMYDIGRMKMTGGHAIGQEGACVDIMHNTAHYVPQGTYSGGWEVRDTKVMYNEFYNFGMNLADVGAYYMRYSGSALGNEVAYNYFYDYGSVNPKLGKAVQGVYYDDGFSHGNCHHNTFIGGAAYGVQLGGGKYNKVESNIMVNMGTGPIVSDNRGESWSNGSGMGNKTIPETQSMLKYVPRYAKIYPYTNQVAEVSSWHAPYGNVIRNNVSDIELTVNARMAELSKVDGNVTVSDHSHFVDPENYDFRIKDDSIFAKKIPELTESSFNLDDVGCTPEVTGNIDTSFELLYPADGTKFNSATAMFVWEKAIMADRYRIRVAKDKDMKQLVYDEIVPYNSTSVDSLEEGREYWWTVEALNRSFKRKAVWGNEAHSFVNTINFIDNISDIMFVINESERKLKNYDLEFFGEAEIEALKKANEEGKVVYNEAVKSGEISKIKLEETVAFLEKAQDAFEKSERLNYVPFKSDYFKNSDAWILNGVDATVTGDGITLERKAADAKNNVTLKDIPGLNDVVQFRARIEYLGDSLEGNFASFDLRRKVTDVAGWSDTSVMLIVKRHKLELQVYPKIAIVATTENKWTNDGGWHDYAIGVINKEDGARIVVAIDGEIAFDYFYTGGALVDEGYFAVLLNGVKVSLGETKLGSLVVDSSATNYFADGTAYSENGEWKTADIKGEADSVVKKSANGTAAWKVDKINGYKRVYFRKVSAADGTASAKVTISTNYISTQEGEEKTQEYTVDMSSGDGEWILIDEGHFQNGTVEVSLMGSGGGSIYANAIRIEEMED